MGQLQLVRIRVIQAHLRDGLVQITHNRHARRRWNSHTHVLLYDARDVAVDAKHDDTKHEIIHVRHDLTTPVRTIELRGGEVTARDSQLLYVRMDANGAHLCIRVSVGMAD